MLKWWVYVLISIFILDFIYRTFIKNKIDIKSIIIGDFSNSIFETNLPQNISEKENNDKIRYEKDKFAPEILHFHSKNKNNKRIEIIEEEDGIVYAPKNKIIEIDEDDIEFEGLIPKPQKRINVTIEYDDKYQNLYNDLSRQLDGNISYLDFYPKVASIQQGKKILKYFLYFSIFISFLFCFSIEKIINCCCNGMDENLKNFFSIIKYFIFGCLYLLHMYFIKKITHTDIFEVYVNQKLKYSTVAKEEPPTYVILYNILKNIDDS